MKIALGSDHHGRPLRAKLAEWLTAHGHTPIDKGTCATESVDYPEIASAVGQAIQSHEADRGILICSSGIGMAMAANKLRGVRAAPCYDERMAEMCRRHNDANLLCLSDDMVGQGRNVRLVEIWVTTPFEGGRHERRVHQIAALEG